AGSAVSVRP
ncbi:major tail protein V, partial [Escherichia coli 5412]